MNRRIAATVTLVLVAWLVSLAPRTGPLGSIQSASAASGIGSDYRGNCIPLPPVGVILPFACRPVANDDRYETPVDTILDVSAPGVLTNDTPSGGWIISVGPSTGGESFVWSTAATAHGGKVKLRTDGSFTYTPPSGFSGFDSFVYKLISGGGSDTATVTISVGAMAVANDDSYATLKNAALTVPAPGVLANDTGFPAPTATPIASGSTAQGGTVTLNADGSFAYTPPADFTGDDSFTYTAMNALGSDSATVTIAVQAPTVAVDDTYEVLKDTVLNISGPGVLANDTGFPAPTATPIASGSTAQGGTVTLNADGSFAYTPPADFTGDDSFTYTASNALGSDSATVTIVVQAPAVANDDSYIATKNTPLNISAPGVLANDTGLPAPVATPISSGATAKGGTVTLNADGSFAYSPPTDFTGDDRFTYTATNALGSDSAEVTITVQAPPVATGDAYTALENTTLNISTPGVLANDTGFPSPSVTPIATGTTAQGGTVTLNADGSFAYTPPADFTGDDSFTYTATNVAGSDTATVTITVRAPAVANDDSYTTSKNTVLNISAPGVLANDTGFPAPTATPIANGATTQGGTVTLNADGSFSYAPKTGFVGNDSFTYTATNAAGSDTATVTVSVQTPPVAIDDSYTARKNTVLNISAPGVLTNDTGFPAPAVTSIVNGSTAQGGTVTLNADGSFSYTPKTDFTGTDSFTYTVTNAAGSDSATVSIAVEAPPVANDDTYDAVQDTTLTIAAPGVLGNDTGFPAPTATPIASGATAQGGTVTLNADGSFSYTPPTGFTGDDSFTYTATNALGSATGTVTIHVQSSPPVVTNDTYPQTVIGNVSIDSSLIPFSVTSNDTFTSPVTITAFDATSAKGGTVSMTTSGSGIGQFTYNPPVGYEGSDSFTYTITNSSGSSTGTVNLSISGMVWFVNNGASSTGDGRLSSPFNSLAAFNAVNDGTGNNPATGDAVFLYESATSYTGPVTLLDNQRLIGQDATASLSSITSLNPSSGSSGFPAMNATNGTTVNITSTSNGINLAKGNLIQGLTVGNATGTGINGSNFGTATIKDTSINDGTGAALSLASGTLDATFGSLASTNAGTTGVNLSSVSGSLTSTTTTIQNPAGAGIQVSNSAAAVSFGNTTVNGSGDTGVKLQSNSGNVSFGSFDIAPDSGKSALVATSNTGTIKTASGTVSTPSAVAIQIAGASAVSKTPLNVTLTSVSANNAANGILLTDTSGSFSVTGNGSTAGSGGTIQSITNRGASFVDASNVSLKYMNFTNADTTNGSGCTSLDSSVDANTNISCNAAIYLKDVTNAALDHIVIDGSEQAGINGNNVTGFTLSNSEVKNAGTKTQSGGIVPESGVQFVNLRGSASITGSNIHDNAVSNLAVHNNSGTLISLAISNTTFSMTGNGTTTNNAGAAGIDFSGQSTADMSLSLKNSTVTKSAQDGLDSSAIGSAKTNTDIEANAFTNNGQRAMSITGQDSAVVTFTVKNNTPITGQVASAINAELLTNADTSVTQNATLTGTITGNSIGTPGVAGSGSSGGDGIDISSDTSPGQTGTVTVAVTNNSINGIENIGIFVANGDGNSTMNVTATDNSIDMQSPVNSFSSLYAESGKGYPDTSGLCLDFKSNTTTNTAGVVGLRVDQRGTSFFRLPGYSGSGTDDSAVQSFLNGQNTLQGSDVLATHESAAGFGGGGACAAP